MPDTKESNAQADEEWFQAFREELDNDDVQERDESENVTRFESRGRPPKSEDERKSERASVTFTPSQYKKVKEKADAAGLSLAAFIRSAALRQDISGKVDAETRRELRRIGATLNELAKVANSAGEIETNERLDILLDTVNEAARRIG